MGYLVISMGYLYKQEHTEQALLIDAAGNDFQFHGFYCLSISKNGLLIAANHEIAFSKDNLLNVVIDPWEQTLAKSIACTVVVKRIAKGDSKGLEKYKYLTECSPNIQSIHGVSFEDMSTDDFKLWSSYIDQSNSNNRYM